MKKPRLIALLLALVLCFQSVPAYAVHTEQDVPETVEEIPARLPEETHEDVEEEPELLALTETVSGYCGGEGDGTNLTWTLTSGGTLTISGTGAMENGGMPPWYDYSQLIKKLLSIIP